MKPLFMVLLLLLLAGSVEATNRESDVSDESHLKDDDGLSFAPFVDEALKREGIVVIFDQTIEPGEELSIPSVVGSSSMGYYIDDQFDLSEAGGFVRIEGSDGSAGGGAVGGAFSRQDGPIQASYIAKNTGRLPRRLLVYTAQEK